MAGTDRNDRRASRRQAAAVLSVALGLLLGAASETRALEIEVIQINSGTERLAGALVEDPFYLDITVAGRNISSVLVTTPRGFQAPLARVSETSWWAESTGYTSLDEMRFDPSLGFGDFVFDFTGDAGESDSVTLSFDPGFSPPFTAYGHTTSPGHLETDVPFEPTMTWICSGTCDDKDYWDLQIVDAASGLWPHSRLMDPTARAWAPGPLAPNSSYYFWIHLAEVLGEGSQSLTTVGGDAFTYDPTFENLNLILFYTDEAVVVFMQPNEIVWTPLPEATHGYDVLRGDLSMLRETGGDFMLATDLCIGEDLPGTTLPHAFDPAPQEGFWFLVRGADASGGLSYESDYSNQVDTRDDEIAMAAGACF